MTQNISSPTDEGLILPHSHDRCRIVGLLLREMREQKFPKQAEFARHITAQLRVLTPDEKVGLRQPNISRVEGLKELAKRTVCEGTLPPRQDFLRFTLVGLGLSVETTSLLRAFIEGRKFRGLSPAEIKSNLGRMPQGSQVRLSREQGADHARVHFEVLRLFKSTFGDKLHARKNIEHVTMHHAPEVQDLSTLSRIIFSYEKRPGQFMRLTKYPAFTVLDDAADEHFVPALGREGGLEEIKKVFGQRRLLAHRRLLTFGERNLHSLPALRRYVEGALTHHLPVGVRRRHLVNVVRLLKSYPNSFKVGLVPDEVETELLINCTRWVLLRASAYHQLLSPNTYHAGPNFIYWSDALSVMRTQLEFEDCWERLSGLGLTEPASVTETIIGVLREACRREPRSGDEEILELLDDPERLQFKLEGGESVPESFFCDELEKTDKPRGRGRRRKRRRKGNPAPAPNRADRPAPEPKLPGAG